MLLRWLKGLATMMTVWVLTTKSWKKGDDQVQEADDNDMVVVKDEDGEEGGLLHMYGGSLIQPLAEQVCKSVSTAVKHSSVVFTIAGRVKLEKSIKQIASSVLGATDPNTNLETEEAKSVFMRLRRGLVSPLLRGG